MSSTEPQPVAAARRPRRRLAGLVVGLCVLAVLAAACGSTSSSSSTTSTTSSSSSTSGSSSTAGVTYAQSQLAKYENVPKWAAPGPALTGTSALKGKTMWYIPIALQVPFFSVVIAGMKQALASLGMSLHVCNGNATASTIAKCLNQAVATKPAAVVTDSINYTLAPTAFKALTSAGIPVVLTGQGYPKTGNDTLSYLSYTGKLMLSLAADAIIVDSKGKANVLLAQIKDTPFTANQITTGALPELKNRCPNCKETVVGETTANYTQFATAVGAAMAKDPTIDYALPQFDSTITGVVAGLNAVGAASRIKMASTTATLAGLKGVSSGKLIADVGMDVHEYGFADVDQALRMILKQPVIQNEVLPLKIFTPTNVKGLELTTTGANSGVWFGTQAYIKGFEKLWGVG